MTLKQQKEVVWQKNCQCDSGASTPTFTISTKHELGDDKCKVTFTYSPGPHCLKCGEPWVLKKGE